MKIILSFILLSSVVLYANSDISNQKIFTETLKNYEKALKLLNKYKIQNDELKEMIRNEAECPKINPFKNIDMKSSLESNIEKRSRVVSKSNNIDDLKYVVKQYQQNLRETPYSKSKILHVLTKGIKVNILSYIEKEDNIFWFKVLYKNGKGQNIMGFIYVPEFDDSYKDALSNN